MTEPQQRCGTCRWRDDEPTVPGGVRYQCHGPIPAGRVPASIMRATVYRMFGTTCPTWALRQEESR